MPTKNGADAIPDVMALLVAMASQDARRAFIQAESGTLKYGDVVAALPKLTGVFTAMGLRAGARVVLATDDDLALATIFIALLRNGLTAVVLNPEARATELARLVDAADPGALILDARLVERLLPEHREKLAILRIDRAAPEDAYPALLKTARSTEPRPSVDPESTAYILFTSGTTSRPKGVEITHRGLFAQMTTFVRQYGFDQRTRLMNLLPLHHTDGLTQGVVVAACAGAVLLRPMRVRINLIGDFVNACHDLKATHLVTVPSLLALILGLGERFHDALRSPWFQFVISTAAYLDPGLWQRFEESYGVRVVNVYGLTETVCETTYCGPDDATRRLGTIGKPVDAEARIVDEAGRELPSGSEGELLIRGPHVMKGYFRLPEETAAVLREGWLHTGDLATVDDDGFYRIVGRRKDVIISAGINVYPEDVNAVLRTVPGIVDAATIGLADERWGEVVVCGLVAQPGGEPSEEQIAAHFLSQASPEKLPREFHFFADFPRGPAGKVVKSDLRRLIEERRAAARHTSAGGSIRDRVFQEAARAFKCRAEDLSAESNPRTTPGWSSLAHVEFLMALEVEFSINLQPDEIMRIDTVGDALALVEKRVAA
jgi:long-chain acyl-CoA synthetase